MMIDTPRFIEPDDVDGGYVPLPVFVTRTTLGAMLSGDLPKAGRIIPFYRFLSANAISQNSAPPTQPSINNDP